MCRRFFPDNSRNPPVVEKLLLIGGVILFAAGIHADMWTETGQLNTPRIYPTATLLTKGKVLATGGRSGATTYLYSCQLYDTTTGTWSIADSMDYRRAYHTATLLFDGRVLVIGGMSGGSVYLFSCELYDPTAGTWVLTDSMNNRRARHTATLLNKGKVLVAGGYNDSYLSSCELYDTTTGTWSTASNLNTGRRDHTATLLPDGEVLVTGGRNTSGTISSCEIYDPTAGTWSPTGSLAFKRMKHTATLLLNGKVLIAGGDTSTTGAPAGSSCELYDPISGSWDTTGSLNIARTVHKTVLLHNSKVLVVGGYTGTNYLATCELYDPASGTWELTDTLNTRRGALDATILQNGKVLAVGGYDGTNYLSSCEIYKPSQMAVVQLLFPNGGEIWQGGTIHSVEWKCDNPSFVDHYTLLYTTNSPGWVVVYDSISSPHPYPNNYDNTWVITQAGAEKILVHFDTLFTEFGYDFVIIYGSNDTSITSYSGVYSDFWTPEVPGDTVKIRLISDASTNCYGLDIDRDSSYYSGTAVWDTMAINVSPSDTTYDWTLPLVNSVACRLKIQALDSLDNIISEDASDANFTIFIPAVEEKPSTGTFAVLDNYPNPFTYQTTIHFMLPSASEVVISVYNIIGQKVATLVRGHKTAGSHSVKWKGEYSNGRKLPSGIYFYKLEAGEHTATKKMFLIR